MGEVRHGVVVAIFSFGRAVMIFVVVFGVEEVVGEGAIGFEKAIFIEVLEFGEFGFLSNDEAVAFDDDAEGIEETFGDHCPGVIF